MHIGMKVWIFDINRRVYTDENGNELDFPSFRGHFGEWYIVGETTQSWIVGAFPTTHPDEGVKYKKKDAHIALVTSEDEISKREWVHYNAHKISERVRRCGYDTLKRIEEILGGE